MSPIDTILNRVKKLLALTVERGATPEEAATACAKAQALLFEHNLSMLQVDTAEFGIPDEKIENVEVKLDANTRTIGWKRSLLYCIAKNNFCSSLYVPGTTIMQVVGKPSNVQVVEYMSATIGAEIERLSRHAAKSVLTKKAAFITSFCNGATSTVISRLNEQEKMNRTASAQCTALVVQSKSELDKAFKAFFPRTIAVNKRRSVSDMSGYNAGREAGKGIGIHTGIGQGSLNRALS